jgi:type IV pilus assembly protein PilN
VTGINLLPHREEKRKARRDQFYALAILMLVIGAAVWVIGYLIISAYISRQEGTNNFLRTEIAALDSQIGEIKKIRSESDALLARKQIIESLQANRAESVYLLNELAKRVPAGVYLRSIKQTGLNVVLAGYAQSSAKVSALMRNLKESELLEKEKIILGEVKTATVGKRTLAEFSMTVTIMRQTSETAARPKPPAAASPNTADKKP